MKVKISAATPVGDLELEVALQKENFIHGFSLHQVLTHLSFHYIPPQYTTSCMRES